MLRSAAIRAFNGSNKQVRLLVGMLSLPNRTLFMILKKQSLLLVFPLHFFRALAASCMSMLHSRTEYSQDFLICQNPSSESVALVLTRWRIGQMTNFQYLTELNKMAGRSFNDLMQYPVFPFVLANFGSKVLDLNDVTSFRY